MSNNSPCLWLHNILSCRNTVVQVTCNSAKARNRAPGMLLQNKAHYATYFGKKFERLGGNTWQHCKTKLLMFVSWQVTCWVLTSATVCQQFRYIHGIQMLPLSPALMLARSPKFNKLEWRLGNGSHSPTCGAEDVGKFQLPSRSFCVVTTLCNPLARSIGSRSRWNNRNIVSIPAIFVWPTWCWIYCK